MSQSPASCSNPASSSSFKVVFDKALKAYRLKTKQDLITHPLASQLQACSSPAAILTILQDLVHQFEQSRRGDERLRRWLSPTINVLYAFSATLGEGVGLVISPAKVISAGAGVLLLAAKDVEASQDLLIDVFERVENFFRRLEIYTHVPPTPAMTEMMVKIMVEVLDVLGTATKEMKQSRFKMFLKKVAGITKLDDGLKKLDKMTNEEARMANAEVLRVTHNIDENVQGVGIQVKGVDEGVQGVSVQVRGVDENVNMLKEKVQMAIDGGREATTEAKMMVQQIAHNVNDVDRRKLRESLRKWQSPPDPSTNHNIACSLQHEGTAGWFCDGNTFEKWKVDGSLLWIHGKPGSGKSVLCSAIIQKITALYEAGSASMAYFYFDFRDVDKRSRHNLLPSLLVQLSARSDPFCDVLSRLYRAHDDGTRRPSESALMRCLKDMLTLPDQGPVYLILDALDECPKTSGVPPIRKQVLDLVRDLVDLRLASLHICVTSRPEIDIQDTLESLASHSISLHGESGQQKDIAEYIRSVVHSDSLREIRRWRDADKDLVIKTLSERADGMFRWVFCQLETLQHCLPQNIPRALRELPTSLDETYERVLKEIVAANRHHAYRLLHCLTVARRPLRIEELAEVLALDFDGAKDGIPELKEDWRWEDQKETVLSTCSSLIAVVDDGRHSVVQFSHFSVKEYLTSDRLATSSADVSLFHIPPEPAHTVFVKACLGILLQSDKGVGDAKAKRNSPLAEYAAEHWIGHAQFEHVSTHIKDGMRRLFDPEKPYFGAWLELYDIDKSWYSLGSLYTGGNTPRGSPLYYASLCGFRDLAAHLVDENPQHVNARGGRNLSPLGAALHNKHFHTAELLHQRAADVEIRDGDHTLLHFASVNGSVDIGQWLLTHGGDANSREDNLETPLHLAAKNGQLEFVRMLLMYSIIVDAKNKDNRTSLHLASEGGHVKVAWLLLRHGADIATQDLKHNTPLHLASSNVFPKTARLLIEHGADVNAPNGNLKTPLHLASSWKSSYFLEYDEVEHYAKVKTVRVLLEQGADVTARDDTRSMPLHLSLSMRSPKTARLLIEHGADVNALDGSLKTPLHLALSLKNSEYDEVEPNAKVEAVQVLLEHGADVTAKDSTHSTPLHLASSKRSPKIAQLLIEHGADINAMDGKLKTPLHLASSLKNSYSSDSEYEGKTDAKVETRAVRVLLEHSADVTARDNTHSTPLHVASSKGNGEAVKLLIRHGADVNAQDGRRRTPLHRAASSRLACRRNVVGLLLSSGANVSAEDDKGRTPFQIASSRGLSEIAELLRR